MRRRWATQIKRHQGGTARSGLAAVEFALILPVLTSITLMCVDFGRVGHTRILVANSAELGADIGASRWSGSVDASAWEVRIRDAVDAELSQLSDYETGRPVVEIETSAAGIEPGWVQVRVEYPFEMLVQWPHLPNNLLLSENAVAIVTP